MVMSNGYVNGKVDASFWMTQIHKGIKFRKRFAQQAKWTQWRQYYRGNWAPGVLPSNIFFKMLRTVVPRIYFRNPSISIISTKPGIENMLFAQLLERIDNKLLRRMKVKQQMKKIAQNAFMFGCGVGKLGYGAEFSPSPADLRTQNNSSKRSVEYHSNVFGNRPWFQSVHPGAFIVPAGAMDFDSARYAIHHTQRPLAEVKEDPRLKNVAGLTGGRGTRSSIPLDHAKRTAGVENAVEMIDLFEVHDKLTHQVFIIAPYVTDKILYVGDDELQFNNRLPFYPIGFNVDDEVFWATPDSQILEPIQLELNENRTQIMIHRRLSIVKLLVKRNAISPEEAAKMVSEGVKPVIEVDGEVMADVRELSGNDIPDDLFKAYEGTVRDGRETIGLSRNEFGEYQGGSGDTTATEATIVRQAAEIRIDERRDMLADMLVDITEHMHQIIFEQWTDEEVVEVMGPKGVPVWVAFKPSMLREGFYDVSIDPDSSVPETKLARQDKAVKVFGLLNGDPMIDQAKLRRYLMHELHGTVFDDMLVIPGMPGSETNPLQFGQLLTQFQQSGNQGGGA